MVPSTPGQSVHLLRLPAVQAQTGLSRASLYNLIRQGEFPAPIKLTSRSCAWPSNEIAEWIRARIAEGRDAKNVPRQCS